MFFKNRIKKDCIYAPVDGEVFSLDKLNDGVFSKGILGEGVGFRFIGDTVYSPCFGEIILVANTKHAIGIKMKNGAEVLVHVGMDTVELNGEGLKTTVRTGEIIYPGEDIIKIDRDFMEEKHIDLSSALVITNSADYVIDSNQNKKVHVKDELFSIEKR